MEEVHVVYHHPPDYGYRYAYNPNIQGYNGQSSYTHAPTTQGYGLQAGSSVNGPTIRHEPPPPVYVAHSYNTYKPSPYVTEYVTPPVQFSHHSRPEPPQYVHYSRPEPPKYTQYNRQETPQYTYYSRPEPPPPQYTYYSRPDPQQYTHYNDEYRNGNSGSGNGNISSMFSDENPNACRIV